jgi:putative hydrolase of the HAD superfamily
MDITTIFFDVGGTLIHPDMAQLAAPLFAQVQPTREQLVTAERAAKWGRHKNGSADAPTRTGAHAGPVNAGYWKTNFSALLDAIGRFHELLPQLAERAGNSEYWSLADPAAVPVLNELRRHYRLAVISNADGRIEQCLERVGLQQFFEKLIDSGLVGYEKPDPRIFQAALQQMDARPDESLYVGDVYAIDYQGPIAAGMQAVLLDPAGVYRDLNVPRLRSLAELPRWISGQQHASHGGV